MPWKEPGDPRKNKDPWTGRPKQTPPNLESFLRNFYKKILSSLKLRGVSKESYRILNTFLVQSRSKKLAFICSFAFISWFIVGFTKVNPAEQAVITRFGRYTSTLTSGYHWLLKPIDRCTIVNTDKFTPLFATVHLLTRDKNKVSVTLRLDYRIIRLRDYLFTSAIPQLLLQEAIQNTTHSMLAHFNLAQLLTSPHDRFQRPLQTQLNHLIKKNRLGVKVNTLHIESIHVPKTLEAAYLAVANAERDKERAEEDAKAYAMQLEPRAKSEAHQIIVRAESYREKTLVKAKNETIRFLALLQAYKEAPLLTRQRLYLQTLEKLMRHSSVVLYPNSAHPHFLLKLEEPLSKQSDRHSPMQAQKNLKPSLSSKKLHPESSQGTPPLAHSSYDTGGYE